MEAKVKTLNKYIDMNKREYALMRLKELKAKNKGVKNWSLGDCLLKNKFDNDLKSSS